MFVELEDTFYNKREGNRTTELAQVVQLLKPVEVRTYTQEEARSSQAGIQCFACSTISHQLWTVKECFGMARQHEETRVWYGDAAYTWFVRARPDTLPLGVLPVAVFKQHASPSERIAWRTPAGGGSDRLCVMTRAAATSLGRAHDSLFLPSEDGQCGFGASAATNRCIWGSGFIKREKLWPLCAPSYEHGYRQNLGMTPECMFYLAWSKNNVTVIRIRSLTVRPVRPYPVHHLVRP